MPIRSLNRTMGFITAILAPAEVFARPGTLAAIRPGLHLAYICYLVGTQLELLSLQLCLCCYYFFIFL